MLEFFFTFFFGMSSGVHYCFFFLSLSFVHVTCNFNFGFGNSLLCLSCVCGWNGAGGGMFGMGFVFYPLGMVWRHFSV